MTHDDLVNDWRENASRNHERDERFLFALPRVADAVNAEARKLHAEAFAALDCTRCGHCCRALEVELTSPDIDRLAAHLGMAREAFIERYLLPYRGDLERDEEGRPREHRFNASPCPMLGADGRCTVYEARPGVCRVFPSTDKTGLLERPWVLSDQATECPGVYYVLRGLKRLIRRR